MKKILVGLVLVVLTALAVGAFFGGCSSAPTTSATSAAAEEAVADNWNPPASSGRQAAEAKEATEEAASKSSGDAGWSCVPNFFRGDGMSPMFWIIFGIWAMTQLIPTKIDDVALYIGLVVMTLMSWVGKGCMGEYNPFSPWWWLFVTIWVIYGVGKMKKVLANRRWILRWGAIVAVWIILGVFS